MKTKLLAACAVVFCIVSLLVSWTLRTNYEQRLSRLESRVLTIESDPLLARGAEQRIADQFSEEKLRKDVTNLQIHAYGSAIAKGKLIIHGDEHGVVRLEGWKYYFGLLQQPSEDKLPKQRAHFVARTTKNGEFELSLPPGRYSELHFGGGDLPEGFMFTLNGYPIRDIEILRDQAVELPPIEIVRNSK